MADQSLRGVVGEESAWRVRAAVLGSDGRWLNDSTFAHLGDSDRA